MGRKPRKSRVKRGEYVSWADIMRRHWFQVTADVLCDFDEPLSASQKSQIWADFKDRITLKYVHSHPGHRPFLWWKLEKNMDSPKGYGAQEKLLRECGELSAFEEKKLAYIRTPEVREKEEN